MSFLYHLMFPGSEPVEQAPRVIPVYAQVLASFISHTQIVWPLLYFTLLNINLVALS